MSQEEDDYSLENDPQIGSDEDWDAEIDDQAPAAAGTGGVQVYTMQSVNGMVTITPAAKPKSSEEPVDVQVSWVHEGKNVSVFTSFDDFHTGFPLGRVLDEESGQYYHTGTMRLPPNKYLCRYLVDGDWMVDDNQEVVFSLGYEYNQLIAHAGGDGSGSDDDFSDGDDDDDDSGADSDDWDEFDDAELPDYFGELDQTRELFGSMTSDSPLKKSSSGMVTISPEMFAQAMGGAAASPDGDSAGAGAAADGAPELRPHTHGRRASTLTWDSHRGTFVMAPKLPAGHRRRKSKMGGTDTIPESAEDTALERKKERRRRKKKRQRARKRMSKMLQRNALAGQSRPQHSAQADREALRAEVVKREEEWRKAWVVHEMRTAEKHEADKEAMRNHWKDEREQWIAKLKKYASENAELRDTTNNLTAELDKVRSGNNISAQEFERRSQSVNEKVQFLEGEADKLKADNSKLKEELRAERAAKSATEGALDKANADWKAEVATLRESEGKLTRAIETVKRELVDMNEETEQLRVQLAQRKADFEKQIAEARKEVQLQAEAGAHDKESVQRQLGERIEELNATLAAKDVELEKLRDESSRLSKEVSETKREHEAKGAELEALQAEVEAAKTDLGAEAAKAQELKAKIDELNKQRGALEADHESKVAELEAAVSGLRAELSESKAAADSTITKLQEAESQVARNEAAFQREREELQRKLDLVTKSRENLRGKVEAVSNNAKALRDALFGFKEANLREMSAMKASIEETKKFLQKSLAVQAQQLANTMKKYKKEMSERRKYFNLVQELRGNIRVFCRARPLLNTARDKGTVDVTSYGDGDDQNTIAVVTDKRTNEYEFDRVFRPGVGQDAVFEECKFLVESCMDGYNVCIFAYGQTGSGKTYTMQGEADQPGVYIRALNELFRIRDERVEDYEYTFQVSMLEIYNEQIRDLLIKKEEKPLKIHRTSNGMNVENLTEWDVESEEDILRAMEVGGKNRATGVTNMNEHSSRSHSLVQVKVIGHNLTAGITYFGKLNMIDLAGSERLSRSGATGARMKETVAINKSLSALGNCIEALQKKQSHIPYRDSKLTYLLQDSMGGRAKTLMFINVSPADTDAEETFCSLNFAERVRRVELGKAEKNVAPASSSSTSSSTSTSSSGKTGTKKSSGKRVVKKKG